MLFLDKEHQQNYEVMKKKFHVSGSTEYESACYISSLPFIFNKFKQDLNNFDSPVDWIYNWHDRHLPQFDDESEEDYQERTNTPIDYHLTSSMIQLGNLALNLWNGYEDFNLLDCLGTIEEKYYQIVKESIDIRMGHSPDKVYFLISI